MKGKYLIKNIKLKMVNFFKTNKFSYILYVVSTALLLVPSLILFFFNQEYFKLYSEFVSKYIFIPAFFIGFIIDVFNIIKMLWKTFIGKLIYTVLGFFAFTFSQSIAKHSIYNITNENPDFFQTSVQFLSAIYLIPSWLIYINYIASFIAIFVTVILSIIALFKLDKITSYINRILKLLNIPIKIENKNIIHLYFLPFSSFVFFMYSFSLFPFIDKTIDNNFIKSKILTYSYYPNKVCLNVPIGRYIKLIGTDKVSISNIDKYKYIFLSLGTENQKITFKTMKCDRILNHLTKQSSQ